MKKLLLSGFGLLFTVLTFGQCEPIADFGDAAYGVAPDTVVNFVDGAVNTIYSQQIDVKVPVDGSFTGASFVLVDSARVTSIEGLPAGLSLQCNGNASSECTYLPGTVGCAIISGIPSSGGTYNLIVNLTVYTNFGPYPLPFTGYHIFVDGPTGLNDVPILKLQLADAKPNPARDKAMIQIKTTNSGTGLFRVYDLVGKVVYSKNLMLTQGSNKLEYVTSDLTEGVYIYRVDAFGESMTSRLVVVH